MHENIDSADSSTLGDGANIAVIGGGPTGSFFSIFALKMAKMVGKKLNITIFEPKDFTKDGPGGCNRCGGIISELLVQNLAVEGINLPDSIVQRGINAAFGTEWNPKVKLTLGEGIAGDVLRTGRAELINNVSMDLRFKSGASHIKSMLCVPLKWKDYNFGVMNMSNSSDRLFTIDDLKLLHSLAIHASIAIENAKNFSKLKNATDEVLRHATVLNI